MSHRRKDNRTETRLHAAALQDLHESHRKDNRTETRLHVAVCHESHRKDNRTETRLHVAALQDRHDSLVPKLYNAPIYNMFATVRCINNTGPPASYPSIKGGD